MVTIRDRGWRDYRWFPPKPTAETLQGIRGTAWVVVRDAPGGRSRADPIWPFHFVATGRCAGLERTLGLARVSSRGVVTECRWAGCGLAFLSARAVFFSGANGSPGISLAMAADDRLESAGADVLLPDVSYSMFAGMNISVVVARVDKFAP